MSVLWISPIIIFAKVSKYQIRFEEFFKKIYIEYVINLLGVVCKSVVVINVQILGNDIFLKHPILYSKKIHNICMHMIITYGTLYCFWNNLYRGRHCIDNIMTLSDEMFEDFMWQGNNIDEPQISRNGKKILSVNTIELNRIALRYCEYIYCKNAGVVCGQHSTNKQPFFFFFTFFKLIWCFCMHIFFQPKFVFITFSDLESNVSFQWFYFSAGPSPAKICVI